MTHTIHHGDNLPILRDLAASGFRAHLIYGDPPFCTGRVFSTRDGAHAYDDRWPSLAAYLDWLEERLQACRSVLTPDGSLVLHVSSTLAYDVKPVLDRVFGRAAFEGHVVWRYRHWPTRRARPGYEDVHDLLLRYVRDPSLPPRWTQLYEPLAPSTLKTWGTGRQEAVVRDGKRVRSRVTAEASPGVPLSNVWEIPIVAPSGRERTGYPTQKPEALLRRVVDSLTQEGDTVLDPWCGSGTAVAVAARMGRVGVGVDLSEEAVRVARCRVALAMRCADFERWAASVPDPGAGPLAVGPVQAPVE